MAISSCSKSNNNRYHRTINRSSYHNKYRIMTYAKQHKFKALKVLSNKNLVILVLGIICTISLLNHATSLTQLPSQQQQQQIQLQEAKQQQAALALQQQQQQQGPAKTTRPPDIKIDHTHVETAVDKQKTTSFFDTLFMLIQKQAPSSTKIERNYGDNCKIKDEGVSSDTFYTEEELLQCLQIPDDITNDLKEKLSSFTNQLPKEFPKNMYKGKGIVMVGGGKFSMMSYLAIKFLRHHGNTLPVEVFIPPTDSVDPDFCQAIETKFGNARCISLESILSSHIIDDFEFKGYQFKSLALMASSFAQVLLIDADNFIAKPIDHIFNQEPFTSKGLVTWPDYWKRLTSPKFYEIAGITVGEKRVRYAIDDVTEPSRYTASPSSAAADGDGDDGSKTAGSASADTASAPYHDREGAIPEGSTESGQLLVDKYKHCGTLLLSLYFNVYGPSHFYPILGQGKAGEGDKDTFVAAAHYYHLPYYQVKNAPSTSGFFKKDSSFKGVAMLHSDPVEDFKRYKKVSSIAASNANTSSKKKKAKALLKNQKQQPAPYSLKDDFSKYFDYRDIMFVHAHLPKFDPVFLFDTKEIIEDGEHVRMYTDTSFCNRCDFELEVFSDMHQAVCDANNVKFAYLNPMTIPQLNDICSFIGEHRDYLQKTTKSITGVAA